MMKPSADVMAEIERIEAMDIKFHCRITLSGFVFAAAYFIKLGLMEGSVTAAMATVYDHYWSDYPEAIADGVPAAH